MTEPDDSEIQWPPRGTIAWEREEPDEYRATELGSETKGTGPNPIEAIRDYLDQVDAGQGGIEEP